MFLRKALKHYFFRRRAESSNALWSSSEALLCAGDELKFVDINVAHNHRRALFLTHALFEVNDKSFLAVTRWQSWRKADAEARSLLQWTQLKKKKKILHTSMHIQSTHKHTADYPVSSSVPPLAEVQKTWSSKRVFYLVHLIFTWSVSFYPRLWTKFHKTCIFL